MSYLPIENYGIIGDLHTAALVGMNGSIDWLCFPRFDSPSVFAAILDDAKGGRFQIAPVHDGATHKQLYLHETNVLVTRFLTPDGVGEVTDFMPIHASPEMEVHHQVIRSVKVVRGEMAFRLQCRPAFDYARATHETEVFPDGAVFRTPDLSLGLATRIPLARDGDGVVADFTLREGEMTSFAFQDIPPGAGCSTCAS
ncbi:MAG: trehalase-like domain-containing protein, partial [Dehalococcoidia bacterium]